MSFIKNAEQRFEAIQWTGINGIDIQTFVSDLLTRHHDGPAGATVGGQLYGGQLSTGVLIVSLNHHREVIRVQPQGYLVYEVGVGFFRQTEAQFEARYRQAP